jgi:hypothetical protein
MQVQAHEKDNDVRKSGIPLLDTEKPELDGTRSQVFQLDAQDPGKHPPELHGHASPVPELHGDLGGVEMEGEAGVAEMDGGRHVYELPANERER